MKSRIGIFGIVFRGLRKLCPRCGHGRIFSGFYRLHHECGQCGLVFQRDAIDTLTFMYVSTAFITGLGILGMFWLVPQNLWMGRILLGVLALSVIILTLPYRKGMAVALDYWLENKLGKEGEDPF